VSRRYSSGYRALRRLERSRAAGKTFSPDGPFGAMAAHPVLPRGEQLDLCRAASHADALAWEGWPADGGLARGRLAAASVRLVVRTAGKEAARAAAATHGGERPDVEEMVADGLLTLMKCTELFDPDRGNAFSTYLTTSLVMNYRSPRLRRYRPASLEGRRAGGGTIGESLAAPGGDDEAAEADERAELAGLIETLDPRSRRIVEARHGLGGCERLTLGMLGKELRITKERVRQIEARAILRLRLAADQSEQEVA
jgi:RNA polymerase sigma factor (sigma-70 family)